MSSRLIKFSVIVIVMMALTGCFGSDRNSNDSSAQKAPESEESNASELLVPDVEVPDVEVPDVEVPDVEVPDVEVPDVEVPDVEVPDVEVPDVEVPDVEVPDVYTVELNTPASVKQNTVFTMTATSVENEGAVSYRWSLNNSLISEDATHHTLLPILGDYTLTVIGTDESGNEATQSKTISVVAQTTLNPDFSFAINVSDKTGYALTGASVTINDTEVMTDQFGLAQFDGISQTALMLVSASKAGYLTQTYQYNFDAAQENATGTLTLQSINSFSHTVDSNAAIDIIETELHTKLMLKANSFVDANGNSVTGDIEVTITPVDIRAVDNAFLGGGQALTDSGEAVALISMGMADYQFTQNGSAVSLAEGSSATIEMDLVVTTGDDGRVFVEGDAIEMWWFDPKTGFWIEDGVGTVKLSDESETGLKLVATVDHFTTWNWDYYKQGDRATLIFKCLKDGLPLTSNESCQITASSTTISREFNASSEGVTAINTAPNVTYSVFANMTSGSSLWAGSTIFTSTPGSNDINVDMGITPTQTGYVQCRVINNAVTNIVPCNTVVYANSTPEQTVEGSDFVNFRAPFIYVKGDFLSLSSTVNGSLNRLTSIDTASVNGTLDIEIVFNVQIGSLQCSVSLDDSSLEYFPCDALVTADDDESNFAIQTGDFYGSPAKADFSYSQNAQSLNIEVASIFDTAVLREIGDDVGGFFMSGQPTELYIDLTTETPVANVVYDIQSENVYSFRCVKGINYNDGSIIFRDDDSITNVGDDVDCEFALYSSLENVIFEGNISELTSSDILPVWMNGKLHLENAAESLGYAYQRLGQYRNSSEGFEIDAVNNVITFTLSEVPQ
jgi:hypothetical protein